MKQIRPTPTSEPHLVPPNVQPRERRAVRCGEQERDSGVDESGDSTEADCRVSAATKIVDLDKMNASSAT